MAAFLRPSNSKKWVYCAHSPHIEAAHPSVDTAENLAGRCAHWCWAQVLEQFKSPEGTQVLASDFIGHRDPDGTQVDEHIAEGAQFFVNEVLSSLQAWGVPLSELHIERPLYIGGIHPAVSGTPDAYAVVPKHNTLYVWDDKEGHLFEGVFSNWQMLNYANGIVDSVGLSAFPDWKIVFTIVQPFCYTASGPVRTWEITIGEARAYWNVLRTAAERVFTHPNEATAGPWCRFCSGLRHCSVGRASVHNFIFHSGTVDPSEMSPADMAAEMKIIQQGLPVVRRYLDELTDSVTQAVEDGDTTAGLSMQTQKGALKWLDEVDPAVVRALAEQFGVKTHTKETLRTPRQLLNDATREARLTLEPILKSLTTRPTKRALVPAENSRARAAFTKKR